MAGLAKTGAQTQPSGGWYTDLEEYIRQGEPGRTERSQAWKTAIGLQAVDGLSTSEYLLETAKDHIEGQISMGEVQQRISSYYEQRDVRRESEAETREADVVSAHIAELLGENTFAFKPGELSRIHRRLFEGVFSHAGEQRVYNITKKEWVLKGQTVLYAPWDSISDTLEYDFSRESAFSYEGLSAEEFIRHLAQFASGVWQIHPFGEGNTRTTAVFLIKYLRSLGISAENDTFAQNSWYFRNALVRANYSNLHDGVHKTTRYLELFLRNLILGEDHELKNRFLHVDWVGEDGSGESSPQGAIQSATSQNLKGQNGTLNGTLFEVLILKLLESEPSITQKEASERLNIPLRTLKRRIASLQEKGLLEREGSKKTGRWVVVTSADERRGDGDE